jgi:hypothetical protein
VGGPFITNEKKMLVQSKNEMKKTANIGAVKIRFTADKVSVPFNNIQTLSHLSTVGRHSGKIMPKFQIITFCIK